MSNVLILIAIVVVFIGLLCGGFVVFLLFIARSKILANSLTPTYTLIGRIGIVQIPFDYRSKGKIRLCIDNANMDLVAQTDHPYAFKQGDPVLVVHIKNTHAWVVPGNIFE